MKIIRAVRMPIANFQSTDRRKPSNTNGLRSYFGLDAFWKHDAKTPRECSGRCQKLLVKALFVALLSQKPNLLLIRIFYD